MNADDIEISKGSGNVFADLGLPDADDMLLKSTIVLELRRLIEARRLSQTAAAEVIGMGQANLSRLLRGQFRGYSVDRLMRLLTALGQDVEIVMRPHPEAGEDGRISFRAATA